MRYISFFAIVLFVNSLSTTAIGVRPAFAQESGTVHKIGEERAFAGTFNSVTKNEITLTQRIGNREETIPTNLISRIEFQGEPAGLGIARANERAGNLEIALSAYEKLVPNLSGNRIKSEVQFLIARTSAKLAQANAQYAASALTKLKEFISANPDHYRFYVANQLLGQVALTLKEWSEAETAFQQLEQAPWNDVKIQGKIGLAESLFAQNRIEEAKSLFDAAATVPAQTPAEQVVQREAMLGQGKCLIQQKQLLEARIVLQNVVTTAGREEPRALAESYVLLGNSYVTDAAHSKDALLAYLHVDVLASLSAFPDLHAEALYNLANLWPVVSQPARGSDALARLQQEYPNSEWAKKLGPGQRIENTASTPEPEAETAEENQSL